MAGGILVMLLAAVPLLLFAVPPAVSWNVRRLCRKLGIELANLATARSATDDALKFIQDKPIRVVSLYDLVQMSRELAEDIGSAGNG